MKSRFWEIFTACQSLLQDRVTLIVPSWNGEFERNFEEIWEDKIQNEVSLGGSPTIKVALLQENKNWQMRIEVLYQKQKERCHSPSLWTENGSPLPKHKVSLSNSNDIWNRPLQEFVLELIRMSWFLVSTFCRQCVISVLTFCLTLSHAVSRTGKLL